MPVNNNDIQRAELLNKILELTDKINQGSTGLNLSAVQAQNFANRLELIRAKAQDASGELGRFNQQLLKVIQSIETGNATQVRIGGDRFRTSQFTQAYQNAVNTGATVSAATRISQTPIIPPLPTISQPPISAPANSGYYLPPQAPSVPLPNIPLPRISPTANIVGDRQGLISKGIAILTREQAEIEKLVNRAQQTVLKSSLNEPPGVQTNPDWVNYQEPPNMGTRVRYPDTGNTQTGLGPAGRIYGEWGTGKYTYQSGTKEPPFDPNQGTWYADFQRWNREDEYRKKSARQKARQQQADEEARQREANYAPPTSTGGGGSVPPSGGPTWGGYTGGGTGGGRPPGGTGFNNSSPYYDWGEPDPMWNVNPFDKFPQGRGVPFSAKPAWWDQATKQSKYYGFNPEDLQSVTTEASSGISKLSYQQVDELTGAFKNLNLTVDKSGNVLVDTQKRFRDFFSEVGRNTVEFLKWSIAVSLVLGPLQKFSELMGDAIENESKLADISVNLADGQTTVAQVFSASNEIATQAGEEINTVLDAYQVAYRAIGGGIEPTTRFAQANKLLSDSLILSKLTGMDEAKAIDTLSAALRQSFSGDGALSQGITLLDKWVATSKVANVDLGTLSTGFAIVGDAADAAGLSIDRLNGLLAAIAETGVASGTEVANAARAIISGFQSDQAKKLLSSLGIATSVEGQTRPFDDILSEIATKRKQGVLGGEQFNDLTLTLGGGSRRQAVWATLIENYDRVGQVAEASSKAGGDAQEAMAKKTATVQTSVTRLGNAFQTLAQNLGTKGGMLDNFRLLTEFGTTLVKIFDTLTGSLGKAFPLAVAGLGALAFLGGKSPQTRNAASIGGLLSNVFVPQQQTQTATLAARDAFAISANKSKLVRGATGLLTAAIPTISNLSDDTLSNEEKTFKVVGDIVGGLVGSLGGPAGAIIGVTIAEAFTSAVIDAANKDYTGTFGKLAAKVQNIPVNEKGEVLSPIDQAIADMEKRIATSSPISPEGAEALKYSNLIPGSYVGPQIIANEEKGFETSVIDRARSQFYKNEGLKQLTERNLGKTYTQRKIEEAPIEEILDLVIETTDGNIKQLYIEYKALLERKKNEAQGLTGKLPEDTINKFYEENKDVISGVQSNLSANLFDMFNKGEINRSTLGRGLTQTKNLNSLGINWYSAFGEGQDVSQFFQKSGRISAFGAEEDISAINEFSQSIIKYDGIIKDTTKSDEEHAQALKDKAEAMKIVTTLFEQGNQAILAQAQLAPVSDIYGLNEQQDKMISDRAKRIRDADLAIQVQKGIITQEQADAKKKESTPFLSQRSDTDYGFYPKGEVSQDYYEKARDLLVKEGALPKYGKDRGVEIQSYDLTSSEFTKIFEEQYPKILSQLQASGYTENKSDVIPVLTDKILPQMQLDTKVMSLLLQQIADNTKELTGEFNLPEGMSFNIPYTWLSQASKGGTGGLLKELGGAGAPGSTKAEAFGSMLSGYQEEPYYGEVKADLYPSQTYAVQNYDWEDYAKMASGGNIEGSPLSAFKRLEAESLSNPYGINSGRGTYAPGPGFSSPDAGVGISAITDRLNVLNNSLQEFADRPINLNLTTTATLIMDSKVIGEAVSRYIGIKLSALGGTFAGARPAVSM